MTFADKLKEARKNAGLSQEQLAEKMCVSRQAITKWETGRGMPDIDNMKSISSLLNVSIDHLLNDDENTSFNEIREKIDLDSYKGEGIKLVKADKCILDKYSNADRIISLTRQKKLGKLENIADFIIGAGSLQIGDQLANLDQHFYLAETAGKQFFVVIDNDYMTSYAVAKPYKEKKFERGEYIYKFGKTLK